MTHSTDNKFAYYLGSTMYINVTNKCTNKCVFCIRSTGDSVGGVNLVLEDEKFTYEDVIREVRDAFSDECSEIVFCGYGEPLIKLDIVKHTAKFIRENYPEIPVRINTNGHGNLIHRRNIVPELKGLIDKVSVSLNADTAELYAELANPVYEKSIAYEGVRDFIKECSQNGIETTATVVSGFGNYKIDIDKCRQIAEGLGAKFRAREWLPQGYDN